MNNLKLFCSLFLVCCAAIGIGFYIGTSFLSNDEKALISYVITCVLAYVLYCISWQAKHEEIEKWSDSDEQ
ncbi:MAG: hypothetical protein GW890_11875 [Vibrio sp.]|nr:hypothetical protein [Vibrio sp.]